MPYKVYRRKKGSDKKVYIEDKSDYKVIKKKGTNGRPDYYIRYDGDSRESSVCDCQSSNSNVATSRRMIVINTNDNWDLSSYTSSMDMTIVIDTELGIGGTKEILLPSPTSSNVNKNITILLAKNIYTDNGVRIGFRNSDTNFLVGSLLVTAIPAT